MNDKHLTILINAILFTIIILWAVFVKADPIYLRDNNYRVKELVKDDTVYDQKLNQELKVGKEVGNGYKAIRDAHTLEVKGFYREGIIYDNKYNYEGYYNHRTVRDNGLNYRRYIDKRK